MVHENPPDSATEIGSLLASLADRMRGRFFARLQDEQLSPPQFGLLKLLDEPRPMSALCQALFCDASNITGMADRLEERGLVERRADPGDRRVRLLALTPKGRRLRNRLTDGMIPELPGLAAMSDADRRELLHLLQRAFDGA